MFLGRRNRRKGDHQRGEEHVVRTLVASDLRVTLTLTVADVADVADVAGVADVADVVDVMDMVDVADVVVTVLVVTVLVVDLVIDADGQRRTWEEGNEREWGKP